MEVREFFSWKLLIQFVWRSHCGYYKLQRKDTLQKRNIHVLTPNFGCLNSCRRCFSLMSELYSYTNHLQLTSELAHRYVLHWRRHTKRQCERGKSFQNKKQTNKRSCELLRGLTIWGVWFFFLFQCFVTCTWYIQQFLRLFTKNKTGTENDYFDWRVRPPVTPPHPTKPRYSFVSLLKNGILQQNYCLFAFTESLTIENVCMARDFVPKVQCGNHSTFSFKLYSMKLRKRGCWKRKKNTNIEDTVKEAPYLKLVMT